MEKKRNSGSRNRNGFFSSREKRDSKAQFEDAQQTFDGNPFSRLKDDQNPPRQRNQVYAETLRDRNEDIVFVPQQNNIDDHDDEEEEQILPSNNNQFNMGDQLGGVSQNFNEPDASFGQKQKMTLNQIQNKWNDASKKVDSIQLQEQQNIKCSIEIKNGIPQRSLNNFHKNQNALVLNKYTVSRSNQVFWLNFFVVQKGMWGLLIFLYETMFIFDHFVLLVHLCALAISGRGDTTGYFHVVYISAASILTTGFHNLLHDNKLKQAAEKVNSKPVEKFIFSKRHKSFQISDWGSIKTGDIIKIKANQEIPCDALILNIVGSKNEHQTCYQRGSLWDDAKNPTLKRSYQGTMNRTGSYISDSKFADQISGLLKWEYSHRGYFTGDFKQIDSPAAFEIQANNVVQRGSYVSHCQFMVCLALNVGISSMGNGFRSPEQLQARLKRSLLQKKILLRPEGVQFRALRTFSIFSLIICLVPCILVLFEDFALKNTSLGKFATTFINIQPSSNLEKARTMFDVMAGFMMNLPYLSHITMEAVVYFHASFVLWDINLVPANIMFTNLRTMKTLGQVDTIICSKAAFLNPNLGYVAAFKVGDIYCFNQAEQKRQQIGAHAIDEVESQNSSEISDEEDQETLEYLPNQTQILNSFQSTVANQLLDPSHPKHEDFREFLFALTLCHHATTLKVHPPQHQQASFTYKSLYKEEESQLQFADLYGFQFKSRYNRMLTIVKQGSLQRFEEIIIRKIKYQDDWVTVQVIKPFQTFQQGAKIYYKGNLRIIQSLLRQDAKKNHESDIDKFSKEGIHAIGIAKRDMETDEAIELSRILQDNNSKKGTDDNNDSFLMQLAQNLDLIGVLGMKTATNIRDALIMEEMRQNGVKLVLLSTDSTAETITDLNALKIFNQYKQPINIIGRTDRQVEESLKSSLKQLVEKRVNNPQSNENSSEDKTASNISRVAGSIPKMKKEKTNDKSFSPNKQMKANTQNSLAEVFDQDQKDSVFVNGQTLQFILKDETLTKLFLTVCSMCTLVVGSAVTPYQKRDLTAAIRQFSIQGKQGYVVSVVAQQADKFMSLEADITVGIQKNYQQSDLLACSDVQIRDIYGITYLLFKHGTILHRRLQIVLNEFIYRTVLLQIIQLFFFVTSGFTTIMPYNAIFFATHVALVSPVLYFIEGIIHVDYGYGVFHRIFGEYKFNKTHNLSILDFMSVILSSLFDSLLLCFFYGAWTTTWVEDLHATHDGKPLAWQTKTVMNSIILATAQYWRNRTTLCVTKIFAFINFTVLLLSLTLVLEDDYLAGVQTMITSPFAIGYLLFFLLVMSLKQYLMHFYQFWTTKNKLLVERYQNIEDRLFMEEYEDPEQTFKISDSVAFSSLVKQVEDTKLFSINQNLLKVHRSDSIDQILDRINASGGQSAEGNNSNFTNRSMINMLNLKLNDINKEIEYNEVSISDSLVKNSVILIWTSALLYALLGLFKIFNQILENNDSTKSNGTKTTLEKSNTAGNLIETIYIEVFEVIVSLSAIYLIRRVKSARSDLVVFGLVVIFNVMVNVYFYIDPENPLIQIQFLYTIAFSHLIRLNSVFFVSFVCLASAIGFLNIRLATIQEISTNIDDIHSKDSSIQLVWQALAVTFYIFFWTYYTYWDEIKQKVCFVTQFRHIKELQKLKSIINILIPSIVRSRIQDGKKNFSDSQDEVTVIFVDIEGFDQLVQQYTGRELIELLDRVYNTFDSLCEQHGLQKIETVGKTYMACGGLKVVEKDIDNRLLGSHHSVRVTDFACNVQSYVHTQTLRNSKKLSVKIGIHIGEVIAGVVGETKPQFSLIGPTINKTSRVCSKCPLNKILISKETHQSLQATASNFTFGAMKVDMKGIGLEDVYTVQKRRIQQSKLIGQRSKIVRNNQTRQSNEDAGRMRNNKDLNNKSGANDGRDQRAQDNQNDQDEDQGGGQNMETFRTFNDGRSSNKNSNRSIQNENETDRQQKSNKDDSYEDDVAGNILKVNELKDDKQIVKSAALNERYNLVERPRFLISFELKDQEQVFLHSLLKQNYSLEVFQLVSKSIIDLIIIECLVYSYFGSESYYIYIGVFCAQAIAEVGLLYYMRKLSANGIMIFLVVQIIGIAVSMIFFILNGPKFTNFLLRSSQQMTLGIYQAIIVISKAIPFRIFASVQIILFIALIAQNFFFIDLLVLNVQTYAIDSILQLVLFALLILASHTREMKVRRKYNQQRIIEVEIEKTQELLQKLVPQHVLQGILNDQRVVDSLENVTLLYTDMVGFTEFSKNNKPQEVVNLLSRLFSKFDQLCEQIGVYKVHTIGDCYVIMSYTGKIAKERRSSTIQIEEAFRVIQVGLEMIKIITEERTKTKNPALKNLDMRIGIHTGKIVGGIIGTKVVRYDIFGQDVLIANKMESNGIAGQVCISEQTYKLVQKNKFVSDTLDFREHLSCQIGTIGKTIKTFLVQQILKDVGGEAFSEEEEGDAEGQDDRSPRSSDTSYGNQNDKSDESDSNDNPEGSNQNENSQQSYEE